VRPAVATGALERPLVNLDLVRWHLTASATFLAVSVLGGLAYAFQFHNLYPFQGVELLSAGRVRMVHTNMAAYGFIANAFIAGMLFAIPRLTRRPILSDPLGWVIFGAWQLLMVLTMFVLLSVYVMSFEL
jgi:cytochrome c oxidase cbb3-type subunit 1